jgi:hypothetical protein
MRFTQEELEAAIAEFQQNAKQRIVPAFGYNKDITVYGAENEPVQTTSGSSAGDDLGGNDGE